MFGYVTADPAALSSEQFARYRGCYCGLCRALGQACGEICRSCLNYDMTFLLLLLSSLYEPTEESGENRCVVHPFRAHTWWQNELTRYGAYMNVVLAYYNCMDDWQDERNAVRLMQAKLFERAARHAQDCYPRQCGVISTQLAKIASLEREKAGADALAGAFGNLMAELFVYQEDRWSDLLREFGAALGRFIYVMDAVCDLQTDQKRKQFNPLLSLDAQPQHFKGHLTLLIAEAAEAFERLPLVQDIELLRSILYQGVWQKYDRKFQTVKEKQT